MTSPAIGPIPGPLLARWAALPSPLGSVTLAHAVALRDAAGLTDDAAMGLVLDDLDAGGFVFADLDAGGVVHNGDCGCGDAA
jgi:hypothetical protein